MYVEPITLKARKRLVSPIRSRQSQIERLNGGNFDVLIVGAGAVEAAIYSTLAARGLSVAYVSPRDFGAQPNQESPGLIDDNYSAFGKVNGSWKPDSGTAKLLTPTVGAVKQTFRSLVRPQDRANLAAVSKNAISGSFLNNTARPHLIRQSQLEKLDPAIRNSSFTGAVDYEVMHLPQWPGRLAMNFIAEANSHNNQQAFAANYLKVIGATRIASGFWEVELKDSLDASCISLIAKVVINSRNPEISSTPELTISDEQTALVKNTTVSFDNFLHDSSRKPSQPAYLQITNSERRRVVLHRSANGVIATSTVLCEGPPKLYSEVSETEIRSVLTSINTAIKHTSLGREVSTADIRATSVAHSIKKTDKKYPRLLSDLKSYTQREQLQVDARQGLVNLVGARIANSYYLCIEIETIAKRLGVKFRTSDASAETGTPVSPIWYEPKSTKQDVLKEYFFDTVSEVFSDLAGTEPDVHLRRLALGLWQRHKKNAFAVLEVIAQNPSLIKQITPKLDLVYAELAIMRDQESITCMRDFLARRTHLSQIIGDELFESISEEKLATALRLSALHETS